MTKKNIGLLGMIVAAMANAAAPYHMASAAEIKGLVKDKLVETNPEITDGDKVAVRATDAGVEADKANKLAAEQPAAPKEPVNLSFGKGFAMPEGTRAGAKAELYSFDTLAVGDCIFVPVTASKPDPAKSLASTVSAATRRYAVEIAGQTRTNRAGETVPALRKTRQFVVVAVKEGTVCGDYVAPGEGAVIARLPDATDAAEAPADA